MADPQQYLSTDPTAGAAQQAPEGATYLSTDPAAGIRLGLSNTDGASGMIAPPTMPLTGQATIALDVGGKHVLLPLHGSFKNDDDVNAAIQAFKATNAHLGIFDNLKDATAFGQRLAATSPAHAQTAGLANALGVNPGALGISGVTDTASDLAIGAGKEFLHHVSGAGDWLRQHVPGMQAADDRIGVLPVNETPSNTAQRIGGMGENIGEVLAPMGAIGNAERVAQAIASPRLAPVIGSTAARLLPRMAVQGGATAAQAAFQGQNPVAAGAVGAAIPAVGEVIAGQSPALAQTAVKQVTQALGATKERFKAMSGQVAPEMLRRDVTGVLGASREGLQATAQAAATEARHGIDAAIQKYGGRQIGSAALAQIDQALEVAKAPFYRTRTFSIPEAISEGVAVIGANGQTVLRNGAKLVGNQIEMPVIFDARPVRQLAALQQTLRNLGPQTTVEHLVALRKVWDKIAAQAGGYAHRAGGAIGVPLTDISEAWAKRKGATAIRAILEQATPELAAINREFHFWKSLSEILQQTLKRTAPQRPSLLAGVAQAGGAAAGASHGIGAAFGAAKVAKMAHAIFNSPRWLLISARLKNQLADAIMSGASWRVANAVARVFAVEGAGSIGGDNEQRLLETAAPEQREAYGRQRLLTISNAYFSAPHMDGAGAFADAINDIPVESRRIMFGADVSTGLTMFARALKASANEPDLAKRVARMDRDGLHIHNPLAGDTITVDSDVFVKMLLTPSVGKLMGEALTRTFEGRPISAGLAAELINAARAAGLSNAEHPTETEPSQQIGPYQVRQAP